MGLMVFSRWALNICSERLLSQHGFLDVHLQLCRMIDPDATKPDDWDEDAPRQIEDEDAEKPDGWLDDEPAEIDDPGEHKNRPQYLSSEKSSICRL